MCGIVGYLSNNPVPVDKLHRLRDRLVHRGPDDFGSWQNGNATVWLGHRRLSIIDLSKGSHQPFVSADERCIIVFNGEIYNYQEIRAELEVEGHRFRSSGDTEVVLAAYLEWGVACVERFNGMFAFAIYDQGSGNLPEQLFIARDRIGKKPFYYRHSCMDFEFASELKAINNSGDIDLQALNHYLALGYIPFDLCIVKGVKKLLPAQAGIFDVRSGVLKTWSYWSLPANEPLENLTGVHLAEESYDLLKNSVRLRLRSDVPVGVFLSGGLDSSLVMAAAAEVSEQPVKTFTIAVPDSMLDESAHARLIADHFGSDHHVLNIPKPSLDVLDELIPFIDEPLADSSILPTYLISKLTVQHVKVALGGDGGDELYGGYRRYQQPLFDKTHFGWLPSNLLNAVGRLFVKLPAGVRGRNRVASLREGIHYSNVWGTPYFDVELRRRILDPDIIKYLDEELDLPERSLLNLMAGGCDIVDSLTRADFHSLLPDDFLVKVDRASMSNSLEVRSPFLDYRIVEHAFSRIPSSWKISYTERRRVQNLMARSYLPKEFAIDRKQGFSVPIDEWIRKSNINPYLENMPEFINKKELERLVSGQMAGRANGARLFALMILTLSHRNIYGSSK